MVISVLQPVRQPSVNNILSPTMQIRGQQKTVPTLSPSEKTLFGNIETSAKKMTTQDLMTMMGLAHS